MNNKEKSPFTPGDPAPYELFVGRIDQIKEALKYVKQSSHGKQENMFLSGERGIGKTSLASFLRHYVTNNMNMLGIHVFLGGIFILEEMVRNIFDELLKETKTQTWFKNISSLFGNSIKEIGLMGVSVTFNPPQKQLRELTREFPEAVDHLLKKIRKHKTGFFVALDGINGLAETVEFANWYKSFVDYVATHYDNFPVFIMLIGLPENRDVLSKHQPSLLRILRVMEIEKLSDAEVREFFWNSFNTVKIKVEDKAEDLMVHYSSGFPALMQEIGDATFWKDDDSLIDRRDAMRGVIDASKNVGEKYLTHKVYRAIHSPTYRSILGKLSDATPGRSFTKKKIEEVLSSKEKRVFHNFLRRFTGLGIIRSDIKRGPGAYEFVNELYPIYIRMKSAEFK